MSYVISHTMSYTTCLTRSAVVSLSTAAILRCRACNQVRATESDRVQFYMDLHQGPCPSSASHATAISLHGPQPIVTAGTVVLKGRHAPIPRASSPNPSLHDPIFLPGYFACTKRVQSVRSHANELWA